jgi:hypothetical protein
MGTVASARQKGFKVARFRSFKVSEVSEVQGFKSFKVSEVSPTPWREGITNLRNLASFQSQADRRPDRLPL